MASLSEAPAFLWFCFFLLFPLVSTHVDMSPFMSGYFDMFPLILLVKIVCKNNLKPDDILHLARNKISGSRVIQNCTMVLNAICLLAIIFIPRVSPFMILTICKRFSPRLPNVRILIPISLAQ